MMQIVCTNFRNEIIIPDPVSGLACPVVIRTENFIKIRPQLSTEFSLLFTRGLEDRPQA